MKLRTHNPMELIMLAIRRRTRVVSALPDGECVVMLFGLTPQQVISTHWGAGKYRSKDWLKHKDMEA